MPNQCQPQGVTKTVLNPVADKDGKYVLDFEVTEDNGVASASCLCLMLNDDVDRADIDIVFNPAILRTRFDEVTVSINSSTATNLNFYTINSSEHIDDYTTAVKTTVAIAAAGPQVIVIKKENDVVLFNDNTNCQRVNLYPAPEDGSTPSTP